MNIKEIFEKAEGGTLTFEQFETAMKAGNANFIDLSEGNYVSKQKYEREIATKDGTITELNNTINQRDTDLTDLKKQLESAGTDSTKLSELQTNFDNLQNKYTADMKGYQDKLAHQQYEFAVKEFAGTKKFTSNAAKRDFTSAMIEAGLKLDNKNNILGAEDFVKSYSEDNSDAFVVEQPKPEGNPAPAPAKPTFAQPTGAIQTPQSGDNSGLFHFSFNDVRGTKK